MCRIENNVLVGGSFQAYIRGRPVLEPRVDNFAELHNVIEALASAEQLSGIGNGREKKPLRHGRRMFAGNPNSIGTGELAAMHAEQFA